MRDRARAGRPASPAAPLVPASSADSSASDGGLVIAYLHRAVEDDKKRLADMLHDELGGALTAGQGRSTWLEVSMSCSGDRCRLSVRHDAEDTAEQRPELRRRRLDSMRHRARSLGGTVELLTSPGAGTRIELLFPVTDSGVSPRPA